MRVALTQGEGRLEPLETLLRARGFSVLRAPLIETRPVSPEEARTAAAALRDCPWLLFTSRSAAEAWPVLGLTLAGFLLGATGGATAAALRANGGEVAVTGESGTAAGLAAAFLRHPAARGPVGLPRGDRALLDLERALRDAGFEVRAAVLYRTRPRRWDVTEAVDAVVLASPSAVRALPDTVGRRAHLIALGPTTGAAVAARGWACRQAARPDARAVLATLETLCQP